MKIEWNNRAYNWIFGTSAALGCLFFLERYPGKSLWVYALAAFAVGAITTSILFWGGELLIRGRELLHQLVQTVARQSASGRDGCAPSGRAKLVQH